MQITASSTEDVKVISIAGSLDALTAGQASEHFAAQMKGGPPKLVLDLAQVDFMSSAGLRAILGGLKDARQLGGDLFLAAPQAGVEKTLTVSGFITILKVFRTVPEAVAAFRA